MDETKARTLADKLYNTPTDDDLAPWLNLILAFAAEVRKDERERAIDAVTETIVRLGLPKPDKDEVAFKLPVKRWFAQRFYDHDGSLGGGQITIGPEQIDWITGLVMAMPADTPEHKELQQVLNWLKSGETVDMWFEV